MRFRGSDIQSMQPAVNPRIADNIVVIDGHNFRWDSLGPKSGFPSRILSNKPVDISFETNSLTLGPYTLICSPKAIMTWPQLPPYTWQVCAIFDDDIPRTQRSLWCGFYMNGAVFISQEFLGFFSGVEIDTDILRFTEEDENSILGLIPNIQGMAIVRGRGIMVNETTIQWSNTGSMSDLTPGLGGAGFQVIEQITKGTYVGLSTYEDGFIVYTTGGGITADYIGGDAVWRFDQLRSIDRPIEKGACTITLTGDTILLTNQGVKLQTAKNVTQDIDPKFNEYLRYYLEDSTDLIRHWRLEYDYRRQQLFVMESTDLVNYNKAFVCHLTLGKWGIFSDRVMGFLAFTPDLYGYIDQNGLSHYFTDNHVNEIVPLNTSMLSKRLATRDKYIQSVINTPLIAASVTVASEYPITFDLSTDAIAQRDGWFINGSHNSIPTLTLGSLDSWLEIGYFRPPELGDGPSRGSDIQNFIVQNIISLPWINLTSDMTADNIKSWYSQLVIQDYMIGGVDEDWNTLGGAEDWNGQQTELSRYSYDFSVSSSFDGIIIDSENYSLSRFYPAMQVWTGTTSGIFTQIRFEVNGAFEYFHVQYLESNLTAGANTI